MANITTRCHREAGLISILEESLRKSASVRARKRPPSLHLWEAKCPFGEPSGTSLFAKPTRQPYRREEDPFDKALKSP